MLTSIQKDDKEFLLDLTYTNYSYNRSLGMSHISLVNILKLNDKIANEFNIKYCNAKEKDNGK